jgi:ABC-type nitrate/sulfonate/bicarbonate transport system substrate-binding protein
MKMISDGSTARSLKMRYAVIALIILAIVIAAFMLLQTKMSPAPLLAKVRIAVPIQINSALMIVADRQALFEDAGVAINTQSFELGKDALKSVIDGSADLAVVADTALMFALLEGHQFDILTGISQGRRSLAIVTRNDSNIKGLQDLSGKSVGLSMGTNLTYFLDMMLLTRKVPVKDVHLVNLNTTELISAFKQGRVDAAVVYQPYLAKLEIELGERIKVFYGEDVYSFRFLLVGKREYIDSHPQEIERILKGLIAAERSIHEHPIAARDLIGKAIKANEKLMIKLFDPQDYRIVLDQAMLLALDDQTRWAIRRGIVNFRPIPNYLDNIRYQNLEAILPSAVKIIH